MRKRLRVTIFPKRDTSLATAYCSLGKDQFCKTIKEILKKWTDNEEIKLDPLIDRGVNIRKPVNVYIGIPDDLYHKLSAYPAGIRGDIIRSILTMAFAQALTGIETGFTRSEEENQEETALFPELNIEDNGKEEEEDVFGALSGLFGGLSVD